MVLLPETANQPCKRREATTHYDGANLIRITDSNNATIYAFTWANGKPVSLVDSTGTTYWDIKFIRHLARREKHLEVAKRKIAINGTGIRKKTSRSGGKE